MSMLPDVVAVRSAMAMPAVPPAMNTPWRRTRCDLAADDTRSVRSHASIPVTSKMVLLACWSVFMEAGRVKADFSSNSAVMASHVLRKSATCVCCTKSPDESAVGSSWYSSSTPPSSTSPVAGSQSFCVYVSVHGTSPVGQLTPSHSTQTKATPLLAMVTSSAGTVAVMSSSASRPSTSMTTLALESTMESSVFLMVNCKTMWLGKTCLTQVTRNSDSDSVSCTGADDLNNLPQSASSGTPLSISSYMDDTTAGDDSDATGASDPLAPAAARCCWSAMFCAAWSWSCRATVRTRSKGVEKLAAVL
mmetsp:Transcript_10172/g.23925  ORF Transcript_10172/g.23925 Transcript_10172/m.23925 type:complete len:305 (-) Transcript_10172:677-1591(-)